MEKHFSSVFLIPCRKRPLSVIKVKHNKYYEENNSSFAPKCMLSKFQDGYRL
jgi:hypothetical protein